MKTLASQEGILVEENKYPMTITFKDGSMDKFLAYYEENKEVIEDRLRNIGAIHVVGINIDNVDKFGTLMKNLCPKAPDFLDGNSSRGKYSSNVYNASEYDEASIVRLHTEFSYSNIYPKKIFFCCQNPASTGGQTTVGDCKKALELIEPEVVKAFDEKEIIYIRNLHSGGGLGPSWQEAFETEDKDFMEAYCKENGIEVNWKANGIVRLTQRRPAIRKHPVTGDRLWFNQVDQFFPAIYGEEIYETLLEMNGGEKDALPMFSRFADGTEIKKEYIENIIKVLDDITIPVPWQKGDLLMVDNMTALHGRLPFTGPRKILASMG
ncbi:TauD/TfdA family dioxygenase [Flavobacterium sp. ENC]|uniref:TauD/TfdA family dioxygenase n=1 Tax=Flavobacterium sp. ENC TaxID=2897330 RepID=UPI001E45ADDA|nr:TauD/TfdA family dioxygenase [Flavobacterium sp. ENC]MCD0468049.1 TauD/TfdA family dioxygenase [Flavobacterium sp. ENC]